MKLSRAPGFLAYATLLMWFLLTVLAPMRVQAQEAAGLTALRVADILPDIEAALIASGAAADAEIALAEPDATFLIEAGTAPHFEHVSFNRASGRFLIRARGAAESIAVAGFARPRVALPVLARPVGRGEIIAETDIAWMETTEARVASVVTDADRLIGMTARRDLAAGTPLRAHDVSAPVLVKRGGLVTISFESAGLRLTHAGVALRDAGDGEVVEVRNIKSERVVKAVVAGPGLVAAIPARRALAATEM